MDNNDTQKKKKCLVCSDSVRSLQLRLLLCFHAVSRHCITSCVLLPVTSFHRSICLVSCLRSEIKIPICTNFFKPKPAKSFVSCNLLIGANKYCSCGAVLFRSPGWWRRRQDFLLDRGLPSSQVPRQLLPILYLGVAVIYGLADNLCNFVTGIFIPQYHFPFSVALSFGQVGACNCKEFQEMMRGRCNLSCLVSTQCHVYSLWTI